ncbi:MAG: Hint domain-containing protein, partial [Paracoccaceae bacterium]|nr:Hint domain-containing protein [Paracoccaceae bacterium]
TITHINGQAIVAGQTITLGTGEQIRLNADGTITVFSDGDLGANALTYGIVDAAGNTDVGFVTINTVAAVTPDGIVQGTAGNDLIDTSYTGDLDGDLVDANDALLAGQTGNDDIIFAWVGDDTVHAGLGNDRVHGDVGADLLYGDAGNDTLYGDDGNDTLYGGTGDDVLAGGANDDALYGGDGADTLDGGNGNDLLQGEAGDDSLTGGAGADTLDGGDGNDTLIGGVGDDVLNGGIGADLMQGGDDSDSFTAGGGDVVDGGEGGNDFDTLTVNDVLSIALDPLNAENGTITFIDSSVMTFSNIEYLIVNGGPNDVVDGTAGDDLMGVGYVDLQGDQIDGTDGDRDAIYGYGGNDTLIGGADADTLFGGDDRDSFLVGAGDVVDGGEGGDDFDTLDLRPYGKALTNITYDPANSENGTVEFLDGNGAVIGTMNFSNIEQVIPCFTPGCLIETDRGARPVEDLIPGDKVLTRDNGAQTLRWVGKRQLSRADLMAQDRFCPVRFRAGAFGAGMPARDMMVSPQHRVLFTGPRAEMLFGEPEVLVAAAHLLGTRGVHRVFPAPVCYIHLLFDAHEIIRADGIWTESFQPGDLTLNSMQSAQRAELLAIFPALQRADALYPAARRSLRAHEARVLMSA